MTPEDAYYNEWTPRPDRLDYGLKKTMKLDNGEKKRTMNLESHWRGGNKLTRVWGIPQTRRKHPKWKDQYVFEMDVNTWATEMMNLREPEAVIDDGPTEEHRKCRPTIS